MKAYPILIVVGILAVIAGLWVVNTNTAQVACTKEAKVCPDGSTVGRTGPKCEFAECPIAPPATTTVAIGGQIVINGTTIGILELLEDSRCPVDVQCIQAGTVRVRAAINALSRDFTFALNRPQEVGTATVTLTSVIPAQKYSQQTIQKSDYRFGFSVIPKTSTSAPASGIYCAADVRQCPDGSYAGRTGPKCEFICPSTSTTGVHGTVFVGPTCPVIQDPPDPQCADKPYSTTISLRPVGSNTVVATGKSDAAGIFSIPVPPGVYTISAQGGITFPRCGSIDITILATSGYGTADLYCDSGIR